MVLVSSEIIGVIGIACEIFGFILMIKYYNKKPTENDWEKWKTKHLINKGITSIEEKYRATIEMDDTPKGLRESVHQGFVTSWNIRSRYLPIGLVIFGLALQGIQLLAD